MRIVNAAFCFNCSTHFPMLREVIIDGYNLLHAAGLARPTYGAGDLDRARRRLLLRVADLIDEAYRELFTIVFDAKDPPVDLPDRGEFKSMHIRYAQDHAEADDLIEELIHAHSTPKRLLVVSGDQRLRQAAKRKGANSITSEEFLDALEAEAELQPRKVETTRPDSGEAFQDVALQFSELDIALLREEIESEPKSPAASQVARPDGAETVPVTEKTDARTTTQPQVTEESRIMASDDEVTFWNARIAELLREET
jgi:predicted RNA-binding protein with PIN domain